MARTLRHDVWAVVGLSPDRDRPSYGVAWRLQQAGKKIVPVHPGVESVLGEPAYASLADIPYPVDVVNVFRRSDQAGAHVDEAIAVGAQAVWLQIGVVDSAAAQRASDAGLDVVMDRCAAVELVLHR
jgi:predicted CoA-binding protein